MNLRSLLARLREYDTALLANTIGYIDPTPPELLYMGQTIRCLTPEEGYLQAERGGLIDGAQARRKFKR